MPEWFYNEDFWRSYESSLFDEDRIEQAPQEAYNIISLANLEGPESLKILDLCCGIGRHSIAMAMMGHQVTGVDISKDYLERAKKTAKIAGVDVDFHQADVKEFQLDDEFDLAISMFTSFGYFENDEDNRKVLKNIYDSLKEGGSFVMDIVGKEVISRIFLDRAWFVKDGILCLEEREIVDDFRRIKSKRIVIDGKNRKDYEFTVWLYSAGEIHIMLSDAGFKDVTVYGDLEGSPYDNDAKRLVVVATK